MAIERIHGIVTDIVRHSDRHNIVTLFTREKGSVSFLTSARSGRSDKIRNARLQLLSVVESDVNFKGTSRLPSLSSVTTVDVWKDMYFNPVKGAIVMFIAEFLHRYLREAAPDPLFWDFVRESLRILDERRVGTSNFHISFLKSALQFAGISPDMSDYEKGDYFDMCSGVFVAERPAHNYFLYPEEASFLPKFMRINFNNDKFFRFRAGERKRVMGSLLRYYSVHFPGMAAMRSPSVLAEVFS